MKKVLYYLKPYIPRMSLGLLIKFTGTVMDLLLPWILSYLIDDVVPLESIPLILLWGGAHHQHRGQPDGLLGGAAYHRSDAP